MTADTDVQQQISVTRKAVEAEGRRKYLQRTGLSVIGVLIALLVWWGLAEQQGFALPSPIDAGRDIAENLFQSTYLEQKGLSDGGGYTVHLLATVWRVMAGVALGGLLGVSLGLLSLPVKAIQEVVNPLAAFFGAAPIFVAAPFFLIWFGITPWAQVGMVGFYTALLMYIFSRRAGENLAAGYVESALTLGGTPRSIFRYIYLPGTVPEIAGGFRISLAGAWGLAAISELLGAQEGAGFLIKFYATAFRVDGMISMVLLLGLVAILVDRIVVFGLTYLIRWTESGRSLDL
ncbi:MAG: ABC transporter permease subunit [Acidimicrobiales bacterium]|jgi:ABC-type nitrate/sulfonate/bicarbonate transport system permease component|nr:ABC transporter permease subunit [Acidimicrobiales bacterium]